MKKKKPAAKKPMKKENQGFPVKKILEIALLILPAVMVMVLLLVAYSAESLYPFGDKTLSWCDMNQQQVPLMIDFKDILDGKSSMFMNFENASGMNFWGVFFFFLASPFTFLVKFIDKDNVMLFMNVLVMLKMMTSAFTAMLYFRKCHKDLDCTIAVILSFMYGMCGYGMLFYQNLIWLDMMALLPLLLLSLDTLVKKHKVLPYTLALAATIIVNYYISYMMIVFIMLFMGAYILLNGKEKIKESGILFLGGSLVGGLISAVVWLPSFIQYLSSARTESIYENLANSGFLTAYHTTMPLIFCTAFIFVVVLINTFSGTRQKREQRMYIYLFVLTLVPVIVEPINKMWHTGSYMSFPIRYGFITVFLGLICTAGFLSQKHELKGYGHLIFSGIISITVIYIYYQFSSVYVEDNFDTLTAYPSTLWGNENSFKGLLELFIITFACYAVVYLFYKKGYMLKSVFAVFICVIAFMEAYVNTGVYVTSPATIHPNQVTEHMQVTDLADRIDDDSFYRVKTDQKLFDYNLVGSLGYPSISHYTSLTDENYMFTMKRLGYTSVWMKMGSSGGTPITDAFLCANYEITGYPDSSRETVYSNERYAIQKNNLNGRLGLITNRDLSDCEEIPEKLQRREVQSYIYENLFNRNDAVIKYNYTSAGDGFSDDGKKVKINTGTTITYDIYVSGHQRLYFDCFDKITNNLSEPIFESFEVSVNDGVVCDRYPYEDNNGVLYLGGFKDTYVTVKLTCKKSINCYSFGVFGVDIESVKSVVDDASYVDFTRDAGTLTGTCNANEGDSCFLSVPYNEGFTIKVNGEKVDYKKAFSAFISFPLQKGENNIVVTYTPKGFVAGLLLTILGIGLAVAYVVYRKKITIPDIAKTISSIVIIVASIATAIIIYVYPLLVNMMAKTE